MPSYSVSQAKENLSKLIDDALNGDVVAITRHGKPAVRLVVDSSTEPQPLKRAVSDEALAELAEIRSMMPKIEGLSWVEEIRKMRDE